MTQSYMAALDAIKEAVDDLVMATEEVDGGRVRDTQLTDTQVTALRATPRILVPTPGAGKAIIVDKVYAVLDDDAGTYTESADNLVIEYTDGTDIMTMETTGWVGGAVSPRVQMPPYTAVFAPIANAGVQIKNSGDGEFGGGNAANSLSLRVYYHVVDVVAFA